MIVDKRDRSKEDIILGKIAFISTDEETHTLGLKLFDGSVYGKEKNRPGFSQTKFNVYDFKLDLDELVGPVKRKDSGPKEATLTHLFRSIEEKEAKGANAIAEQMEVQQRFSFAFAPVIFCVLGVAMSLLPRASRASRPWAFFLCLFWLLAYYSLLSLGKALGDKGLLHPVPALWLPNVVVGVIATFLFTKALRESPLRSQTWIESAAIWTNNRLTWLSR